MKTKTLFTYVIITNQLSIEFEINYEDGNGKDRLTIDTNGNIDGCYWFSMTIVSGLNRGMYIFGGESRIKHNLNDRKQFLELLEQTGKWNSIDLDDKLMKLFTNMKDN